MSRSGEERQPPRVERSEVLIIDTRKAAQVEDSVPHEHGGAPSAEPWEHAAAAEAARSRRRRQLTEEMLAGTGAAMLLFLIVAMAWRCHQARSQGLSKRRLLLADDSISAGENAPLTFPKSSLCVVFICLHTFAVSFLCVFELAFCTFLLIRSFFISAWDCKFCLLEFQFAFAL